MRFTSKIALQRTRSALLHSPQSRQPLGHSVRRPRL